MKLSKLALVFGLINAPAFAVTELDLTNKDSTLSYLYSEIYPDYEWFSSRSFKSTSKGIAAVRFKINKNDSTFAKSYWVQISNGNDGKQRIYFEYKTKYCKEKKDERETKIFKVELVNVKMSFYCANGIASFTPQTTKGEGFVINKFRKEERTSIVIEGEFVAFDAAGFNNAWLYHGGNAI